MSFKPYGEGELLGRCASGPALPSVVSVPDESARASGQSAVPARRVAHVPTRADVAAIDVELDSGLLALHVRCRQRVALARVGSFRLAVRPPV